MEWGWLPAAGLPGGQAECLASTSSGKVVGSGCGFQNLINPRGMCGATAGGSCRQRSGVRAGTCLDSGWGSLGGPSSGRLGLRPAWSWNWQRAPGIPAPSHKWPFLCCWGPPQLLPPCLLTQSNSLGCFGLSHIFLYQNTASGHLLVVVICMRMCSCAFVCVCVFKQGCNMQTCLEQAGLRPTCLCWLSTGSKGMCHGV